MPSSKLLAKSAHRTLCRCLAKLLSFCGIASFGVVKIIGALALGVATLGFAVFGINNSASAVTSASASTDVTVDLGASISVRVLDTSFDPMSLLAFDLTPTADGVTANKRAVVDVSTSNITGYKLYVEANGKDHNNNYTTNLVQTDTLDSHVIPTSTTTTSNKNFWNYVNPLISTTSVIPAHGTPDKIGQATVPADSSKTNVDINVGIDTAITAGTYQNQLLFTAIANEDTINYSLSFNANLPSGADPSTLANLPATQQASSVASSHTFTIPSTAPTLTGYTFGGFVDPTVTTPGEKGSSTNPYEPGDNVVVNADTSGSSSAVSGSTTLNLAWTIGQATLTVDPNGGTWSGSTSPQQFTQNYGTTKDIADPSADPTYSIDYNMGDTGITKPTSPTSVQRPFTGWTADPTSAWNSSSKAWTFPATAGTLTANYNTTSSGFTLPALEKTGYTCKWHAGSASGTEYNPSQANVTITGNTTFYATCSINSYTLTVNPDGGTWSGSTSSQNFTQNYGTTKSISNPTAGPIYTISYNMTNTAGTTDSTTETTLPAPTSPTSVRRPFTSWSLSGAGSFAGNTFTYGAGAATLKANYNTTSNTFTLPTISKAGYTCTWHAGSATGTSYASGATNVTITDNTTFYGVCESQFWTISNMQEMTTAICNSVYTPSNAVGSAVTLISTAAGYKNVHQSGTANVAQRTLRDVRDTNSYTVRKLADGNCWMTQNLKLVGNATVGYTDLTTTDSDVPAAGFRLTASTAQDYTWCTTNSADCDNQSMVLNSGNDSYGTYYNWYVATAGTGKYETSSGNASNSICPRGWRLPTSGSSGEFQALYNKYSSSSAMRGSPANFVLSGVRDGSSTSSQGSYGGYLSSTAYSPYNAYNLNLNSSDVYPAGIDGKYRGYTVRCVAR